ncbi:MAG: PAS domain-containing protein, partial [Desulfobulbaceae bacterium]|nr:PAS domain-containing protein [Desulfobulbaceae bacterium]
MMADDMKGSVWATKAYLKLFTCMLTVIWIVVVGISLYRDLTQGNENVMKVALDQAEAYFNKNQAIRFWSTKYGGVYVEVDDRTPPNPYLAHLSNRDIKINNKKTLTLMNPAYMIRQMNEEFSKLYGVVGHITSLKPLRPENTPDDWERAALVSFEKGVKERSEVSIINGSPYLRFMRPMLTREGCLKCHGHQGYKVGDIRGGVGAAVPLKSLYALAADQSRTLIVWHSVILCLGIGLITLGFVQLSRRDKARMEAEVALQLSEERFRTVADFSYDWEIWILPDGSCEYVSPSCEHMTGYSQDEFLKNQNLFLDIIHPDDRETLLEHRKLYLNSDDGKADFIGRIITKAGEIRWIWHKCQPVFREDGTWSGRRGSNRDITDLRQAENALRVSEERLHIALQNREMGLWDWDIESGKVLFNQCWVDMLGYSPDEIESSISTWKGLIHPGDAAIFSKKIEDHFLGKSTLYEAEYRLLAKSGQWVWVLDKGKVVEWDSKGKPSRAIGTQLDITARRKQVTRDKEMIRQREHMRRIESLEVMAAAIAHRFNNAMTAVQGNLELMKMTLPDESAEKEMAIRALGAARGASRVGSMMLTYVGQGRPIFPAADLFILVQKTVVEMKGEFPSSITLHFTPAEGPLLCPMDQKQIREVVLTVLTNAIEAMEGI